MNLTQEKKEQIKTITIIVLAVLVFFGVTYMISENTGDRSKDKMMVEKTPSPTGNPLLEEGEVLKEEEQKELTSVSMEDVRNALKNNEKKAIMLGTDTCSWCIYQKPILKALAYRYDIEIGYLNLALLTSEENTELSSLHESLERFGTPTFIIIKDGVVDQVLIGGMTTRELEEILKQYEFID